MKTIGSYCSKIELTITPDTFATVLITLLYIPPDDHSPFRMPA